MEFHLFKNSDIQEIQRGYKTIQISEETEELIPDELKIKQIDLHPGVNIRKRAIHQKAIKVYSKRPDIDTDKPLVLSVISQGKWLKEKEYFQNYAVAVMIRHEATIEIYNRIREQIQQRVRIR